MRAIFAAAVSVVLVAAAACSSSENNDSSSTGGQQGSNSDSPDGSSSSDESNPPSGDSSSSEPGGSSASSDANDAAIVIPPKDIKATLTVLQTSDLSNFEPQVAMFNEIYPNVDVKIRHVESGDYVSALHTALASPEPPDVFETAAGAIDTAFHQFGSDLIPYLAAYFGADWQSEVAMGPLQTLVHDGKLTSVAAGVQGAGTLKYNATMLKEIGVSYPNNYQEWLDVCKAVQAAGKTCVTMGGMDDWATTDVYHTILNQIDPTKFQELVQGNLDPSDPDVIEAFHRYQLLFQNILKPDAAATTTYPDAENEWLAEDAAMLPMGIWDVSMFNSDKISSSREGAGLSSDPFEVLLQPFPDMNPDAKTTNDELWDNFVTFNELANVLAVNKDSTQAALAATFVIITDLETGPAKFWANRLSTAPIRLGVDPDADVADGLVDASEQMPIALKFLKKMGETTDVRPIENPDAQEALFNALSGLETNGLTPEQAAEQLHW